MRAPSIVLLAAAALATPAAGSADAAAPSPLTAQGATVPRTTSAVQPPRVYAYYYLWWSTRHWSDRLGSAYASATRSFSANPLPLPSTLDPSGCNPVSRYAGNHLTDVPRQLWTQDDPALLERDVRDAAAAGLTGFLINWAGTGQATQTPSSTTYSRRLDALVQAVDRVRAQGTPFRLWLSYEAAASARTTSAIVGDLTYLRNRYALDPAFDHSVSTRLPLVWTGSRKYSTSTLEAVARQLRSSFYLIGDENGHTWSAARAASLDAATYYWSSQDPYRNPASFSQIADLASRVRASGPNPDGSPKRWFAPFAPGFDTKLLGGSTCVPRNGLDTMRRLFTGNRASNPDGWILISWNEIAEGTYVVPLQRYGRTYLDGLRSLIAGG